MQCVCVFFLNYARRHFVSIFFSRCRLDMRSMRQSIIITFRFLWDLFVFFFVFEINQWWKVKGHSIFKSIAVIIVIILTYGIDLDVIFHCLFVFFNLFFSYFFQNLDMVFFNPLDLCVCMCERGTKGLTFVLWEIFFSLAYLL